MLEEIRNERIKKLEILKEKGIDPYPAHTNRDISISEILGNLKKNEEAKALHSVAGRILSHREHGGIIFADIFDGTGKLQILCKKDALGDSYDLFISTTDVGDFIEARGVCFTTKRGEKTLEVHEWKLLTKSLLPLPEKWHGLQDVEERYRKRYLDILMNPEVKDIFIKKSKFWKSARNFLEERAFLEVETPVLEASPGGADAEPFITHLNALDIDLYLRISPELSLKRLMVAGFEKIFEIGRIFRNEGIDKEHLQDYTQLEFYWAYADYKALMKFIEEFYKKIIFDTLGSYTHTWNGETIDWGGTWDIHDYAEIMKRDTGLDIINASDEAIESFAKEHKLDTEKHMGRGRMIDLIFKKLVRPKLIQPAFLVHPPIDVEPLAKRMEGDPSRVQRLQIVACGTELGKGFSELNDPLDQRVRFEMQTKLREAGDMEAQRLDEDFIEALEYGMPPTAGFGFSERLFSILIDKPVRETTYFPLMRPK